MERKKLAILTTHPIQYNAPFFKLLAQSESIKLKVFYTGGEQLANGVFDRGFNKSIQWDIPLLEGYDYTFVPNASKKPGSHHFKGIKNPTLINDIESWGAEAILIYGWSYISHLKCLRYFHNKIPVLFRGDSTLLSGKTGALRMLRSVFLKWIYAHVDYALYTGKHNKLYYKEHGLTDDQLIYAPHAIDNSRFFEPDEAYLEASKKIKSALGINKENLVVLFAGKLESVKNPHFILALAEKLSDRRISFVLVGNGHLEIELKERARSMNNVFFLDFQNQQQMPMIYRIGDIFILPSTSETWGLAANEAMASGCVMMLSDMVGGAVDLVDPGINGIIFNHNNVDQCSEFLIQLADDESLLKSMKTASRNKIQRFSYDYSVKAIEDILAHKKLASHA